MTKKNDLAQTRPFGAFVPAESTDTSVKKRAKNWLERAQLAAPLSKVVREKKAQANEFMFGDTNVGEETVVVIVARRDHALWLVDNAAYMESYDRNEEEFGRIVQEVEARTKGAMEGYDFLFWSPEAQEFFYYHVCKTSLDYADEWQSAMPLGPDQPDGPRGPITAVLYNEEHPGSGKGREKHYWNVPRIRLEPGIEVTTLPSPEASSKALKLFSEPRPQGRDDETKGNAKKPAAKAGGRRRKAAAK